MEKSHWRHRKRGVIGPRCWGMALLMAILGSGVALAVQITGQESRVSGQWQEVWDDNDGQVRSASGVFEQFTSGSGLLFWNVGSGPHGWGYSQGVIGPFSLWVTAGAAPWYLPMAGGGMGSLEGTALRVAAESRTRFLYNAPIMSFTLQAEAFWNYHAHEQDMMLVLRDLTLDEVLLRWQLADMSEPSWTSSHSFVAHPGHEYEMVLTGWVGAWDAKDTRMRLWVGWELSGGELRIARVPDAGSTAALLVLGVGGLWGLRRLWGAVDGRM